MLVPSVCSVITASAGVGALAVALGGPDDLVAPELLGRGLHLRRQQPGRGVVARPDQVLLALVEVLRVDAVAHVDQLADGELAQVAGAHLIDVEPRRAVVGALNRADEDDVGERPGRAAFRVLDQTLARHRRRRRLGMRGHRGQGADGHGDQRERSRHPPSDHPRERRRTAATGDVTRRGQKAWVKTSTRPAATAATSKRTAGVGRGVRCSASQAAARRRSRWRLARVTACAGEP